MKSIALYCLPVLFLLVVLGLASPGSTLGATQPPCGNSQNDCKTQTPDHLKATATRNPHGGPCGNSYVDCKETATAIAATPKPTRNPCAGDEGPSEYCATKGPSPTVGVPTATLQPPTQTAVPPSSTAPPGSPTQPIPSASPTRQSSPVVLPLTPTATTGSHPSSSGSAPSQAVPSTLAPASSTAVTAVQITPTVQLVKAIAATQLPHTGDVDLGLLLSIGLALPGVGILVRRLL